MGLTGLGADDSRIRVVEHNVMLTEIVTRGLGEQNLRVTLKRLLSGYNVGVSNRPLCIEYRDNPFKGADAAATTLRSGAAAPAFLSD